ncbi:hypothetical protein JCM6294_1261 [Bacteroides pyogenes DSM 20611 = JCM 6294]|uniref:Uncharacterized protein n=1 Tax=Bacteroides pyogenes DSM 20611 = JCM 6294 TaxID=1121100 RepID=W4PF00_9BACE|nr:hypothetical protein JCM6294_1261 [Bacteroides pyogenes DSM 20611 = JCM 6294]
MHLVDVGALQGYRLKAFAGLACSGPGLFKVEDARESSAKLSYIPSFFDMNKPMGDAVKS